LVMGAVGMVANHRKAVMSRILGSDNSDTDDNEGDTYGLRRQLANVGNPTATLCSG
jgi:hypothetical protein